MRVLLDECVHAGVHAAFRGHAVSTVSKAGWRSTKDPTLLRLAERSFDVFVTIDQRLERQLKTEALRIGIVVVHVRNNKLSAYEPLFEQILQAAESVKRGGVAHVGA